MTKTFPISYVSLASAWFRDEYQVSCRVMLFQVTFRNFTVSDKGTHGIISYKNVLQTSGITESTLYY